MKLLLTSAGVQNKSIRAALVGLLGKPIAESTALCIPTASYAMPGGPGSAYRLITGQSVITMCELGWKSLGVLELSALPSLDHDTWATAVRQTDALLVGGGDAMFLAYWMRESGFADLIPTLQEAVYVGASAGSMVMTPRIGQEFVDSYAWKPPAGGDSALGLVDFSVFPHVDHPNLLPDNSMEEAEQWAAGIGGPAYAIDDDTAIQVADGTVEVVSDGHWRRFPAHPSTPEGTGSA